MRKNLFIQKLKPNLGFHQHSKKWFSFASKKAKSCSVHILSVLDYSDTL